MAEIPSAKSKTTSKYVWLGWRCVYGLWTYSHSINCVCSQFSKQTNVVEMCLVEINMMYKYLDENIDFVNKSVYGRLETWLCLLFLKKWRFCSYICEEWCKSKTCMYIIYIDYIDTKRRSYRFFYSAELHAT